MFHLFSHCWTWLQAVQEPVRKVTLLVVGLDNSGKSSVIMDIMRALASEVLPAAQPGQTRLRVNRFEVTLVELPGAQRCRSAWRSHYGAADGLLFVLDSSDLARMEEARKALSRVLSHPDVSGKPLLLTDHLSLCLSLANKQDVAAALLPCELIERLALQQLVNENHSPCRIEPCAAVGPARSTLQGLRWLLRAAAEHSLQLPTACSPSPDSGPRAAHGRPHARRDPLAQREDESCSAEKIKEPQPTRRLLSPSPQKVSTNGPGKRKKKVKVRKKGTGQLNPAEEPEGGAAGGADGRASTAGGLLAPNRVGQEEPVPAGTAAPHSGERRLWELLALPTQAPQDPQSHPKRGCGDPYTWCCAGPAVPGIFLSSAYRSAGAQSRWHQSGWE
ncbi:ADP-ribosylation factor-like protein 13A [Meleagris gallopavo]|uniref:ADP-ribosylation factor-like protein 13A n=1 Tax=Meleagris gallopavo TaxID=9103 RepID=UPI0012AB73AB|nr:ADP-ribosylation factor-like protein 13A [Meleagris gallopavo]